MSALADHLVEHRDDAFCYLTTTGRVSGDLHEIEIWFFEHAGRAYLLSGGADRSDWVRNLLHDPAVGLRVGPATEPAPGRAVVVDLDDAVQDVARQGLREKYEPGHGASLSRWAIESLLVEVTPL